MSKLTFQLSSKELKSVFNSLKHVFSRTNNNRYFVLCHFDSFVWLTATDKGTTIAYKLGHCKKEISPVLLSYNFLKALVENKRELDLEISTKYIYVNKEVAKIAQIFPILDIKPDVAFKVDSIQFQDAITSALEQLLNVDDASSFIECSCFRSIQNTINIAPFSLALANKILLASDIEIKESFHAVQLLNDKFLIMQHYHSRQKP